MAPLVLLLTMLNAFIIWVYIKFQPKGAHAQTLRIVNWLFPALAAVIGVLSVVRIYTEYTDPLDAPLVPQLAASWSLGLVLIVMTAGFIVRNFIVFRTPRY